MRSYFGQVHHPSNLDAAWRHVRSKGLSSPSREIRGETLDFDKDAGDNLRSLHWRLSRNRFTFDSQFGITKKRAKKQPRPIVVSPIANRIVQRAILQVLKDVPQIKDLLSNPFSVGGIKGVDAAISIVQSAAKYKFKWFIKSDIKDFYTKINKREIADFVGDATKDEKFRDVFKAALDVELENISELGKEAELFPLGDMGVPQGNSLSPIAANIYLQQFDTQMNGRGVICIRYVDDFLLIGKTRKSVEKAFSNGIRLLKKKELDAYEPADSSGKAVIDQLSNGVTFLGCNIKRGLVSPARKNREKLLNDINAVLDSGVRDTRKAISNWSQEEEWPPRGSYWLQTLGHVSNVLMGWGNAYRFCNSLTVFVDLDTKVSNKIARFRRRMAREVRTESLELQRRALGVFMLSDINWRSLDQYEFEESGDTVRVVMQGRRRNSG